MSDRWLWRPRKHVGMSVGMSKMPCSIPMLLPFPVYIIAGFWVPYLIFDVDQWSLSDYVGRTSIRFSAPENMGTGTAVGIAQNILFLTGCLTISGLRRHIWFSYAGTITTFLHRPTRHTTIKKTSTCTWYQNLQVRDECQTCFVPHFQTIYFCPFS